MTIVETISLGAADAESVDYQGYLADAEGVVRSCDLAGWYPVRWRILDHNLPFSLANDHPVLVIATPDEEETPSVPLRFGIIRRGPALMAQWEVYVLRVDADEADWMREATRVRKPSDVGNWIRLHRPRQ